MSTPDEIQNLFAYGWEMYLYDKYAEAFEAFKQAFELGHAEAGYWLGQMYLNNDFVEEDYTKAVEYFQAAFERGEMCAAGELGQMYLNGWGVERDPQKAIEYFNQAAYAHFYGKDEVEANADAALHYFRMAAEAGDADAMNMAGRLYLGEELPFRNVSVILPDRERGLYWLNKAVDRKHVGAMMNLAGLYYEGKEVTRDLEAAHKLYLEVAESYASDTLFGMLAMGTLTEIYIEEADVEEAFKWFQKASAGEYFHLFFDPKEFADFYRRDAEEKERYEFYRKCLYWDGDDSDGDE